MGGIGSLQGAVLGGVIIGCIQQISDNRIGGEWTPAVVFAYLVLIMVFKPQGLLGSRPGRPDEPGPSSAATAISPSRSALLGFALVLPFFFGETSPFMDDAVTALAYVVMALGLNIVVGFAGLLDLGYVAFFAIGAYTIGWLASGFASTRSTTARASTSASASSSQNLPGIHLNFLLVLVGGGDHDRDRGRR